MPEGKYKSRTYRRVKVRVPSGKSRLVYKKRKPSRAICTICKKPLHGVPRERPYKIKRLSKSKRRPERPYGGVLCSSCMRKELIKRARK